MIAYLEQFRSWLHDAIGGRFPFLEYCANQLLSLFTGPFTGINTRLHWVQLVEALLLAAIVYRMGRQVKPRDGWRGFTRYCFPGRIYRHRSARVDYQLLCMNACFGFFFNVTWRVNAVLMTGVFTSGLIWMFGPPPRAQEWSPLSLAALTVLLIVVEDLTNYLYHVMLHKLPPLWAIHKVHHSAEVLTPLTGFRTHPLEYAFAGSIRAAAASLVLAPIAYWFVSPLAPVEILGTGVVVVVFGAAGYQLTHSHVWLSFGPRIDRVLVSPAVHQVHHSQAPEHHDKNFGVLFSVWDWMFGTLFLVKGPENLVFGLHGETSQAHPNFLAAWLLPFWDMVPWRHRIVAIAARLFGPWVGDLAVRAHLIPPSLAHPFLAPVPASSGLTGGAVAAPRLNGSPGPAGG